MLSHKTDVKNGEEMYTNLTLKLSQTLEKLKGVTNVNISKKPAVERSLILSWEQKFSCMMTEDLKNFYLTTNGLFLTWNVKLPEGEIPVGKMEINGIDKLSRLGSFGNYGDKNATLTEILDLEDDLKKGAGQPKFDHRSRIFELDSCDGYGKVCYVYNDTKPGVPAQKAEVWFLDRSLQWHFLSDSFLNYFRLMLTYMGLPHWQYAFTPMGLPAQSQQWYNMYCPNPKHAEVQDNIMGHQENSGHDPSIAFNADRVFRGKSDKKKALVQTPGVPQNINTKKKIPSTTGISNRQSNTTVNRTVPQNQQTKLNR